MQAPSCEKSCTCLPWFAIVFNHMLDVKSIARGEFHHRSYAMAQTHGHTIIYFFMLADGFTWMLGVIFKNSFSNLFTVRYILGLKIALLCILYYTDWIGKRELITVAAILFVSWTTGLPLAIMFNHLSQWCMAWTVSLLSIHFFGHQCYILICF